MKSFMPHRVLAALAVIVTAGMAIYGAQQVARAKEPVNPEVTKPAPTRPYIDVVFAIDCSGSMGPVIETAKQKVWAIVNQVAKAKPAPVLRIGLFGYGDGDRQFRKFNLTDDLDEVYKNLMTFRDEGWADEYVGLIIHKATSEMNWSAGRRGLKIIYVVGNETARQGPLDFDYAVTAPRAIRNDILVNAIYCGNTDYAAATPTWRQIAQLAEGSYMEIAATGGAVTIETPLDKELNELSSLVNKTYIGYGRLAAYGASNQAAQDKNAEAVGGAATAAARASSKSSVQYNNRNWDLVDASREADFDWSKIKDEDLPAEMRNMSAAERKAYVEKKTKERAEIQAKIKAIAARRDAFIETEMKKRGLSGEKSLDENIRRSIIQQAAKKGFSFEK